MRAKPLLDFVPVYIQKVCGQARQKEGGQAESDFVNVSCNLPTETVAKL